MMHNTVEDNLPETLDSYDILNSDIRDELSGLIDLASEICDAPISMINILDHQTQYTKAQRGVELPNLPREDTFCQYALDDDELFIIPDTIEDDRVKHSPFVQQDPHIRFYAGAPLKIENNVLLGTLCIFDTKPRDLTDFQQRSLSLLAEEVVARLKLVKKQKELKKQNEVLKKSAKFLDNSSDVRLIVNAATKKLIEINKEAQEYFDIENESLNHTSFTELIAEYSTTGEIIKFMDSGESQQKTFVARRKYSSNYLTCLEFSFTRHGNRWFITARDISDREEALTKLRDTQVKKEAILESSADAIITVNDKEEIIEFNPAAEKIFQFSKEEIQGKKLSETIVPKRHEEAHERGMQHYIATGEGPIMGRLVELPALRKDGTEFPIEIQVNHIGDTDPPQFMAIIRDITERRENQRKLRQTLTNLNIGQDLADAGSWRWERSKDYLQWTDKVYDIYGIEDVSVKPTTEKLLNRTHPGDLKRVRNKFKAIAEGAEFKEFDHRLLLEDGQTKWVRMKGKTVYGEDGQPKEIYGAIQDITQQKKNQIRLERAKALSDNIIASLPNAFFMFDRDGNAIRWNDELEKRTGYNGQEISYLDPLDFVSPKHRYRVKRALSELFTKGYTTTEADVIDNKGKSIPYIFSASLFKSGDKEFIIGIGQNISALKEYEHRLENSLEEKKVLLSEIHHRVKNNLAIISGLIQLEAFSTDNPSTEKTLSNTQLRIQSMATVHEMLYEAKDFNDLSFDDFISNIIESIETIFGRPEADISFNVDIDEISLNINQAIPCGLIINEIITNAYNHAFPDDQGTITVNLETTQEDVAIKIKDNGQGLPEKISFEDGDSLGFSLIKQLTQQLDADLLLESDEGTAYDINFTKEAIRGAGSSLS